MAYGKYYLKHCRYTVHSAIVTHSLLAAKCLTYFGPRPGSCILVMGKMDKSLNCSPYILCHG